MSVTESIDRHLRITYFFIPLFIIETNDSQHGQKWVVSLAYINPPAPDFKVEEMLHILHHINPDKYSWNYLAGELKRKTRP